MSQKIPGGHRCCTKINGAAELEQTLQRLDSRRTSTCHNNMRKQRVESYVRYPSQLATHLNLWPMAHPTTPNIVPVVTVQPTIGEVVEDVESGLVESDNVWLSLYKTGEPSIHTKVNIGLDEQDRNTVTFACEDSDIAFSSQEKVSILIRTSSEGANREQSYRVSSTSLHLHNGKVYTPCQEYVDTKMASPPHVSVFITYSQKEMTSVAEEN